jgi:hypothetical protein
VGNSSSCLANWERINSTRSGMEAHGWVQDGSGGGGGSREIGVMDERMIFAHRGEKAHADGEKE